MMTLADQGIKKEIVVQEVTNIYYTGETYFSLCCPTTTNSKRTVIHYL